MYTAYIYCTNDTCTLYKWPNFVYNYIVHSGLLVYLKIEFFCFASCCHDDDQSLFKCRIKYSLLTSICATLNSVTANNCKKSS